MSGLRGCGWVGATALALAMASPRSAERVAAELVAHLREVLLLLFLHVVAHVLDEDGDLGVEALVLGIHRVELGQHPLHDVVLLEALEGDVLGLGHGGPGDRVEELLLDGGVDGQLLDDPIDHRSLLGEGVVARLLEALEQRLDRLVVVLEEGDGVHARRATRRAHPPNGQVIDRFRVGGTFRPSKAGKQ